MVIVVMSVVTMIAVIVMCRGVFVMFDPRSRRVVIGRDVGMHIRTLIGPRPDPGTVVDQNIVLAPTKAYAAPSERSERSAY